MLTDSISDMLTRIRNAQAVKKLTVEVPFSKLKIAVLEVLKRHNFIDGFEKIGRGNKKIIEIALKYKKDNAPRISVLKKVSKPSRRVYIKNKEIWPFKQGAGITIISTPKGIMSNKEARKMKLGGEVLAEIW